MMRSKAIPLTSRQHGLYSSFHSKLLSNILNFLSETSINFEDFFFWISNFKILLLVFFFNIIFECSWKWSPCICLYFHRCQTDARIQSNFFWNQLEFCTWLEFKHLLLAISEREEKKKSKIIQKMWNRDTEIFSVAFISLEIEFFVNCMTSQIDTKAEQNAAVTTWQHPCEKLPFKKSGSVPHRCLAGEPMLQF